MLQAAAVSLSPQPPRGRVGMVVVFLCGYRGGKVSLTESRPLPMHVSPFMKDKSAACMVSCVSTTLA